eukprot:978154-Pyramimonas_sp.AAC.1
MRATRPCARCGARTCPRIPRPRGDPKETLCPRGDPKPEASKEVSSAARDCYDTVGKSGAIRFSFIDYLGGFHPPGNLVLGG